MQGNTLISAHKNSHPTVAKGVRQYTKKKKPPYGRGGGGGGGKEGEGGGGYLTLNAEKRRLIGI